LIVLAGSVMPAVASAQEATPTASETNSGMVSMLQLAPDVMAGPDAPDTLIATYADLATQLETIGVARPASIDDENFVRWSFSLESLFFPDLLLQSSLSARWKELIGFDILDIDETLEIGEPPTRTLLRGRFEQNDIEIAWSRLGYQMLEVDGITVASLNADGDFSIDSKLQRYAFSRFNNAAFLPDGTLAYAPTLDGLTEIIAVAQGKAPSLADREDISALVNSLDKQLVSALFTTGDYLRYQTLLGPAADQVTPFPDQIPPIDLALLGVTAGGPVSRPMTQASPTPGIPNASFEIALLMQSEEDAAKAAEIALDRIATGESWLTQRPLTTFFESWDSHVVSDPPVARLSLTFSSDSFATFWLRMVLSRDLPFLAWGS
jgi:hypothetical protein